MLTILIPCAGSGQRFKDAGYKESKPLIDVEGEPMIVRAIESLVREKKRTRLVIIVHESMADEFEPIKQRYAREMGSLYFIKLPIRTNGAACTCLFATGIINNDNPLVIANCDQILDGNLWPLVCQNADGTILTMKGDNNPKWSYTKTHKDKVIQVLEKRVISDRANCGVYWFARGSDFVKYANKMIEADDTTNGEFYVAPVYNYLISDQLRVAEVKCEDYDIKFHGVGTPEDLQAYLKRKK